MGHRTEFVYDAAGRVTETHFADGSFKLTGYDALGRKTSDTDENGRVTQFGYDASGRLTRVTDALGQLTTYTYDEQGNKLTQTDAEGRITRWSYDNAGRVVSRTLPLGQVETFTYDDLGRLESHTDFNGQTATHTFDAAVRIIRTDHADGSVETFGYDAAGNRTSASNAHGSTTHEYDAANRLRRELQPSGAVLEYSYDAFGNKTELRLTVNGQVTVTAYGYDALNRLVRVDDPNSGVTSYTYDAVGNRQTQRYANGTATTYTYDLRNRLTDLTTTASDNSVIQDFSYTLDATGRRTRIVEASGRTSDYGYDTLYRLTSETITDPVNGNHVATYSYDKVGNRLQQTVNGVTTIFSYDANDRLTTQGGTPYTYDANGNTLSDGTATYTYDANNKLITATTSAGSLSFGYNADGIRTTKGINGTETTFVVDSNRDYAQVMLETTGANQTAYSYGDDLISQQQGGVTHYFHVDGLGSTRALTDVSGMATDSLSYDAFGVGLHRDGANAVSLQYRGESYDTDLGLYYLRARWMAPASGRFVSMDPFRGVAGDPVTLHKYLYASADPVNGYDPSGWYTLQDVNSATNVQTILSIIRADVSGQVRGAAFRKLGTMSQDAIAKLARDALEEVVQSAMEDALLGSVRFNDQTALERLDGKKRRIIDFTATAGNLLADIEVKYGVPRNASQGMERLVSQVRSMRSGPNTRRVLMLFKDDVDSADLRRLERQLAEGNAGAVEIIRGTEKIAEYFRDFFRNAL